MILPTKLPPSLAALLGTVLGVIVGGIVVGVAVYAYTTEKDRADTAEAETITVIDGETAARDIRREKYKNIADTKELIKKVESGEEKILTDDGKHINAYFANKLRSKILENRPIPD